MHTICMLSLKGGAGKSTVVQSLAVCAVQHGQNTLVVELDPQGTLKRWSDRRSANYPDYVNQPRVIQTLPQSLDDVLEEARQNDVHWVFLDTPGHNASTAAAAAEFADIILIPCKIQSVKDFDSVLLSLAEANRVNKPAYVLMTQVPPNAHKFVRTRQIEIQQEYNIAVLSKHLSRRADFEYCDAKGLSAAEHNPKGEAAAEVSKLFSLIQSIFIMLKPSPPKIERDYRHIEAANDDSGVEGGVAGIEGIEVSIEEIDLDASATAYAIPVNTEFTDQPASVAQLEQLESQLEGDTLDVPSFLEQLNNGNTQ